MHNQLEYFDNLGRAKIEELLYLEAVSDNMEKSHGLAPTVEEFLKVADLYPQALFNGHIVRNIYGVGTIHIYGITIEGLSYDVAADFVPLFNSADVLQIKPADDGSYNLFASWL